MKMIACCCFANSRRGPDGLLARVEVNSNKSRLNCIGSTPNSTAVVLGVAGLTSPASPSPFSSSFPLLSSLLFFFARVPPTHLSFWRQHSSSTVKQHLLWSRDGRASFGTEEGHRQRISGKGEPSLLYLLGCMNRSSTIPTGTELLVFPSSRLWLGDGGAWQLSFSLLSFAPYSFRCFFSSLPFPCNHKIPFSPHPPLI